jgi:hypothetical protein
MTRQTQHVVQCDLCDFTVTYDDGVEFEDFTQLSIKAPPGTGVHDPLLLAHTCLACTTKIIQTIRKMQR